MGRGIFFARIHALRTEKIIRLQKRKLPTKIAQRVAQVAKARTLPSTRRVPPVVMTMWVSRGATARGLRGSPKIDGNNRMAITLRASGSAA